LTVSGKTSSSGLCSQLKQESDQAGCDLARQQYGDVIQFGVGCDHVRFAIVVQVANRNAAGPFSCGEEAAGMECGTSIARLQVLDALQHPRLDAMVPV